MKRLIKKSLLTLILLVSVNILFAQSNKGFQYQAVARDANGEAISGKTIVVEVSIRKGSKNGSTLWQETHQVKTNNFGLFSVVIGRGNTTGVGILNSFKEIDWSETDMYTGVRADFGNGLLPMGNVQLQAVPYAFVADSALAAPRFNLKELLDVNVPNLQTNDILQWDGTQWKSVNYSQFFSDVYAKLKSDSSAVSNALADKADVTLGNITNTTEARTNLGLGSIATQDVSYSFPYADGTSGQVLSTDGVGNIGWLSLSSDYLSVNSNLSDVPNTSAARTNLGLGSIATQHSDAVAITGGTLDEVNITNSMINLTPIGLTNAASGKFTTVTATNGLYLENNSNMISLNAPSLSNDISLTLPSDQGTSGQVLSTDGSGNMYWLSLSSDYLSVNSNLSDVPNTSEARTNLGLGSIATQDISYSFPYADGTSGQVLTTDGAGSIGWLSLSSDYLSVNSNLSDVSNPSAARTNLGLTIGTDVQAYNSNLDDLADGILSAPKVELGEFFIDGEGSYGQYWMSLGSGRGVWSDLSNVQAYDADLDDLADGTLTASKVELGEYFIDSEGSYGQFWMSMGSGRGRWSELSSLISIDGLSDGKLNGDNFSNSMLLGSNTFGILDNASNNTGVGVHVFEALTSGTYNTALGYSSLNSNTSGSSNTAFGARTLNSNSTGVDNVAIGAHSMSTNLTGSYNTALGSSTIFGVDGIENSTIIGYGATTSTSNTIQLGNTSVTDVKTSGKLTVDDDVVIGSTNAFYIGDPNTEGCWRIRQSGNSIVFEMKMGNDWVARGMF